MELIRRNTEYAIRALVHLATSPEGVVSAGEIARAQDIPIDFLQKVMQKLTRAGLVVSHRGVQGGFSLARAPQEVNLLEVVTVMQGKPAVNRCFLGKDSCPRAPACRLKNNWLALEQKLAAFLAGVTLKELANQLKAGAS
ncbi:MAG: Rrf2 family transcriptional regulator [Bacillota bacterium]